MKRSLILLFTLILILPVFSVSAEETADERYTLLVNTDHPLPEDYVPAELVFLTDVIPEGLCTYEHDGIRADPKAAEALKTLLEAAHADGLTEWQISEGYRSMADQQSILDGMINEYMSGYGMTRDQALEAALFVCALPGCSEHHTGLCFDITVPGEFFADTAQYLWMLENAPRFGLILRYPEDKEDLTGFLSEEWHFRYVGIENALYMTENGLCLEEFAAGS